MGFGGDRPLAADPPRAVSPAPTRHVGAMMPPDRGTRRDAALAATALGGGLVLLSIGAYNTISPPAGTPRALFLVPLIVVSGAVLLRRRAPRTGLALGTLATLADVALGGSLGTLVVYTQVLYDACVYGPARLWRWLLRLSVAATTLGALAGVLAVQAWRGVGVGVVFALVTLIPVLTGISVRQYRDQAVAERARAQAERARAEQTARLAELDRRRAVAAERTRMARELHDVVANHLSAVAIHATAVLSLPDLDEAGIRRALEVIRSSGVQGLAEMRRMIELLRDADDDPHGMLTTAGPPTTAESQTTVGSLAAVGSLIERACMAGLPASLAVAGQRRDLPAAVDLAAYRIVQESLTNALKHGGGPARVTIDHGSRWLVVTVDSRLRSVTDAGEPGHTGGPTAAEEYCGPGTPAALLPGAGAGLPGAGAGLLGMRERVALLAGRFHAGPVPDTGTWRVRAEFPTGPVTDPAPDRTGTTTVSTGAGTGRAP